MANPSAPPAATPPAPARKRRRFWLKLLVVLVALAFFAWELYLLVPAVRVGIVRGLGTFGASDLLLPCCEDAAGEVQVAAIQELVGLGEAAVPTLDKALRDDVRSRRLLSAQILERIGKPAARAIPSLLHAAAKDEDQRVREASIGALNQVGVGNPSVVRALVALLGDPDPSIRKATVIGMRRWTDGDDEIVRGLARSLRNDKDADVRRESAESLEQLGPVAKAGLPALTEALTDPDAGVRREAGEAIEAINRK